MNPHIVVSATPLWSHIRSLCVFAAKVVGERAVDVTILVPHWGDTFSKVSVEVARCLLDVPGSKPSGTVRVIALGSHSVGPTGAATVEVAPFEPVWTRFVDEQPVTCSATSIEHPAARKPSFVVLDGFQYPWYSVVRRLSPAIRILLWNVGFSGGIVRIKESHGAVDLPKGEIVKFDGLPDMAAKEADGFATVCAVGYDGQTALDTLSKWFNSQRPEKQRPLYHLGPIIPMVPGTTDFTPASLKAEMDAAPGDFGSRVVRFLDQASDHYGTHSVVYICFGNFFWPWSNTDHLWLLLDRLADRGIPFILSHSSPLAQIPERVRSKFENSKIGLLSPWSPQQTILAHPATGWFVTHGGMGGTIEAITQGVPMIGWPFLADQPINIAHCVHNLNIAFEFLEVRTPPFGLKPLYLRNGFTPSGTLEAFQKELDGILSALQGEDGVTKRENARKLQQGLRAAWAEGGAARRDFETLLDSYITL